MMEHVSYTELRRNLTRYMNAAVESRAPVVIVRQSGRGNVVLMSEEEFRGWEETVHLLSSPANAERLMRSIGDADAGKTAKRELVTPHA